MTLAERIIETLEWYADAAIEDRAADCGDRAKELLERLRERERANERDGDDLSAYFAAVENVLAICDRMGVDLGAAADTLTAIAMEWE